MMDRKVKKLEELKSQSEQISNAMQMKSVDLAALTDKLVENTVEKERQQLRTACDDKRQEIEHLVKAKAALSKTVYEYFYPK
jgi:phosphoenolpyruvate-protein kinase (PTS system EI component)